MISIQTNVDSLLAQQNLSVDNQFQSNTIKQLTSGYRINSSGDDAAGLAVANGLRSSVTELNQGVLNANNGLSQLQIVDGGLSNISTILDRLKTLATQSASSTFTGSRATLNQEYAGLLKEVDRQASNINLNSGGTFNTNLSVYIGGATQQSNATVGIDLSGKTNAVDSNSLGLSNSNVLNGGVNVAGDTQRLDATGAVFVKGVAGTDDQTFSFNVFANGNASTITATVAASTNGSSLTDVLSSLNSQLNSAGITAGTDSNGLLQFSGASAFTVKDNSTIGAGTNLLTDEQTIKGADVFTAPAAADTLTLTNGAGTVATVTFAGNEKVGQAVAEINAQAGTTGISAVLNSQGTGINLVGGAAAGAFTAANSAASGVFGAAAAATVTAVAGGETNNSSNYSLGGATTYVTQTGAETLQFQTSNGAATVSLANGDTLGNAIAKINAQTSSLGVYAVVNSAGTGISFQGTNSFSLTDTSATAAKGVFGAAATTAAKNVTAQAPTTGSTNNATSAITAINSAITALGLVQGSVGAGENKLNYAVDLAQSQISSYSAAESQIRDANVAAEAANLTKAQVLTQTSVAALAQANSEPQSILKLLQ